jgi:hypothetical protein
MASNNNGLRGGGGRGGSLSRTRRPPNMEEVIHKDRERPRSLFPRGFGSSWCS